MFPSTFPRRARNALLPLFLLSLVSAGTAQDVSFHAANAAPLAEPLPNAFRLATGDLNGDGKTDIAVGNASGVTIALASPDFGFHPGNLLTIPVTCPIPQIALADFNADGLLDLAVYCPQAGMVYSYLGTGDGSFSSSPTRLALNQPSTAGTGLIAADLNGDGSIDLAVGQDGKITVLSGSGGGEFQVAAELILQSNSPSPARPAALVAADLNGDGIPDLAAVTLVYNDDLSVFLGTGGGNFLDVKATGLCRAHDLIAVDYDLDGKTDLAVACDDGLVLLAGNGDGSFHRGPELRSDDRALSVAAADLNGDSLPDFVVGNYYNGRISVVLNTGDGALQLVGAVPSIGDVFAVALADLNGDSNLDLVATSYSGSSALAAEGQGGGQFAPPSYLGTFPANSFPLRIADLDADGKKDVAVISQGRQSISLLLSASQQPTLLKPGGYPIDGAIADFNGDGSPDLALITVPSWRGTEGEDFGAQIRVLSGVGGAFSEELAATPVEQTPASHGHGSLDRRFLALASGDFNGDAIPDLFLANQPHGGLQLYAGNGSGSFRQVADIPISGISDVLSADMDGDGLSDAIVAGNAPGGLTASLYLGASSGEWKKSGSYTLCQGPGTLLLGDFNGDRKPDIAANCGSSFNIILNTGGGLFEMAPQFARRARFSPVAAVADFDGDGRDDIAAAAADTENGAQQLVILFSAAGGSPGTPVPQGVAMNPLSMIAASFESAARPGLAYVDGRDGMLRILTNQPSQQ